MRKSVPIALAFGMLLVISSLVGCREGTPPRTQNEVPAQTAKTGLLDSGWPYLTNEIGQVEPVEKLTRRNFVLIFDGSGSMSERECLGKAGSYADKCEAAKAAVMEWAKTVPEDANVGLVAFHNNGWSQLPLRGLNIGEIAKVLRTVQPGGNTPLGRAFEIAGHMLKKQGGRQLGYGEYTIVSVTDGMATDSKELTEQVKQVLEKSPIIVSTIGFCIGDKHDLNQKGRTIYKTADDPESLRKGLLEVLAEAEKFDVATFSK
ncbi:MAG: VWA domain-containing protein [Desulfomonile tiedjei]|nr:VWA domain-containing protein [Desulfomonile tiedjei]